MNPRTIRRAAFVLIGVWLAFFLPFNNHTDFVASPQLSVDVSLASLDATVLDSNGSPVTTLSAEDFSVYENGELQQVREFISAARSCNVLILIQHSFRTTAIDAFAKTAPTQNGRMDRLVTALWNPFAEFLGDAVNRFAGSLKSTDKVALGVFDLRVQKLFDFREARTAAPQELSVRPFDYTRDVPGLLGWGTDLYGALTWAARTIASQGERKAVVVITDGRDARLDPFLFEAGSDRRVLDPLWGSPDAGEERTFRSAIEALQRGRARFYFIAYGMHANAGLTPDYGLSRYLRTQHMNPQAATAYLERVQARVERLAEASGGRVFYPKNLQDINPLAQQISKDLGAAYSFTYMPSRPASDGTYRRVEVRVKRAGLTVVQSRDGYTAR